MPTPDYPDFVSSTGYGTVTGLCGVNCYHDFYPFIPGISEPIYSEEELRQMNEQENTPKEFGGKSYTAYEATQRQRALETTMRAQRQKISLLEQGGADEQDIINARGQYRATSAEYSRFSQAMGLPQQRERVTVDGLGDVGRGKTKGAEPVPQIRPTRIGSTRADAVTDQERAELLTRPPESGIMSLNRSVKVPDDYVFINGTNNNFDKFSDEELSSDILEAIEKTISEQNSEKSDFKFDNIYVGKFDKDHEKSVFITDVTERGSSLKTTLYLNSNFFIGISKADLDSMCKEMKDNGWWQSECLEDLVNHEIIHARLAYHSGVYKTEQME